MAEFPAPEWFLALGRVMAAEGEIFRRLGYSEVRFIVRVLDDQGQVAAATAVEIDGYTVANARTLAPGDHFDADFAICAPRAVWTRMLDEIAREGRAQLRHTLSALALVGEELWLESDDQLREDRFYRYNQTMQEMFNLSARMPH